MRHQSDHVLEVLATQQRQTHGPIHNWLRSMLHLMAQEGRWPEFHSKISECGFCLYEQFGERKAAITFCEAARSQRRDDAELAAHLAWLYSLEDPQKALKLYDEALALHSSIPLRILMLCRLAVLLAKRGDWLEKGTRLIDEAVALMSQLARSLDSLEAKGRIANAGAFLLYRAGRLSESLDVLRDADILLDSAPPALLQLRFLVRKNIAKILQRQGSADCDVVDAYQRILQLCPDRHDAEQVQYRIVALFTLGIVHAEGGLPAIADGHFRAIVELPYPSFRMSVPALCRYAGDLFARLSYYDYARKWAETQIEYYLVNNRIYDALTTWRTYAASSSAGWSTLAIPGALRNVASHLTPSDLAVPNRADKSRHATACSPIAPVQTRSWQPLTGR
jgi:tetratricopeptide (TPR) repeat protein